MNNIDRFLDNLNKIFPLSSEFWKEMPLMLVEKRKKSGYVFFKPGNIATKAWQLLSGFILMIRKDGEGNEIVSRIYYPEQIVTDLKSFFEGVPIGSKFVGIGDVSVLEIKKADVFKLRQYPEMDKIIQHISFDDIITSDELIHLIRLSPKERVKFFFENYPVYGLACKYCASALHLSNEEYLKNKLLLESEGIFPIKNIEGTKYNDDVSYSAYKVKDYLQKNIGNPDVGNTDQIAELFNTTSRTLNRTFHKSFGCSVMKYILTCRMEQALALLRSDHMSVGEVALAVGYRNIYHFSTGFKKFHSYSPRLVKKL